MVVRLVRRLAVVIVLLAALAGGIGPVVSQSQNADELEALRGQVSAYFIAKASTPRVDHEVIDPRLL